MTDEFAPQDIVWCKRGSLGGGKVVRVKLMEFIPAKVEGRADVWRVQACDEKGRADGRYRHLKADDLSKTRAGAAVSREDWRERKGQ